MRSSISNSEVRQRFFAMAWQLYCRLFARNKLNGPTLPRNGDTLVDSDAAVPAARRRNNLRGTLASFAFLGLAALTYAYIEYKAQRLNADIALRESRQESDAEWHDIVESGKQPTASTRVLVLGNSLLLRGVDFEKVKQSLPRNIDAKRLVVVNTSYFDWYYTMLRLFREGAKADIVVLVLTPKQLSAMSVRQDYFAHHLMRLRDTFSIARDLKLTNTEASSLAFANVSQYYDLRAKIRNRQLVKIFKNLAPLMGMITYEPPPSKKLIPESLIVERLRALRNLAAKQNARFVFLMPPADGGKGDRNSAIVQTAGKRAGIPVLVPVAPGSLPPDHYDDGFHLNPRGEKSFTPRFIASIRQATTVYTAQKESKTANLR